MNERRLATVVRVRALRERLARAEVARQRRAVAEQELHRDRAWAAVADRPDPVRASRGALLAHRSMLRAGVRDANAAGVALDAREHDVDLALDGWRHEAQQLDGIERLAERFATQAAAEAERQAGAELDDLVVTRWVGETTA